MWFYFFVRRRWYSGRETAFRFRYFKRVIGRVVEFDSFS